MKVKYETKIIGIQEVFIVGILEYGTWDNDWDKATWQVFDGRKRHNLDAWLDKFGDREVAITIKLVDAKHCDDERLVEGFEQQFDHLIEE